jgi:hypothetical protein
LLLAVDSVPWLARLRAHLFSLSTTQHLRFAKQRKESQGAYADDLAHGVLGGAVSLSHWRAVTFCGSSETGLPKALHGLSSASICHLMRKLEHAQQVRICAVAGNS